MIRKRGPLALLCALCACVIPASGQTRRAILIGNADYRSVGTLRTPLRDAAGLDDALRKLRFETTLVENVTLDQLTAALDHFVNSVRAGDAVFFYYSGYAVQSADENYLLPVNFDPALNREIDYVAYSVSRILSDLERRKPSFMAFLLDGAWDHPGIRRRFPDLGLARLEAHAPGVFVGLSAGTGRGNSDDPANALSLYASAIVANLQKQGLTLSQIAENVKRSVNQASGGRQTPTEASTVVQDFYVNPKPPDAVAWEKLKDSQDPAALEKFRTAFPSSPFADEAAARLEEMDWAAAQGKGRSALESYLARYPNGKFAVTAHRELDVFLQADRSKGVEQVVQDLLRRYKNALENRDLDELAKIWPALTKQQMATLRAFFRDARSIRVDTAPSGALETSGDYTIVRVHRSIQYTGQAPQNDIVALRMKRSGGGMIIESLAVERQ